MEEWQKILISFFSSLISTFIAGWIWWRYLKRKFENRGSIISESKKIKDTEVVEDKLNRKKLAKTYYDHIMRNNKNKELELSRFSITGKYGYGKTFIIDNLALIHKRNFNVNALKFKAWEQDEFYSPLKRILMEVFKEKNQFNLDENLADKKQKKEIKKYIEAFEILMGSDNMQIPLSIEKYRKKYDFLKSFFSKVGSEDKKILFLIDELDRAKPSDLVEFLELTNHLFGGNKNVIVVYSYDKKNLERIIANQLGVEDPKYIKKFIDLEFKLINENIKYIEAKAKQKEFNWLKGVIKNRDIQMSLRDIDFLLNKFKFIKGQIQDQKIKGLLPQMLMALDIANEGYGHLEKDKSPIEYNEEIKKIFMETIKNCYGDFAKHFDFKLYSIDDFQIQYDKEFLSLNEFNKTHGMKNYEYLIQLIYDGTFEETKISFYFTIKESWFNQERYSSKNILTLHDLLLKKIYNMLYFKKNYYKNIFNINFVGKNKYLLENALSIDISTLIKDSTNGILERLNIMEQTFSGHNFIYTLEPRCPFNKADTEEILSKILSLPIKENDKKSLQDFKTKIYETESALYSNNEK